MKTRQSSIKAFSAEKWETELKTRDFTKDRSRLDEMLSELLTAKLRDCLGHLHLSSFLERALDLLHRPPPELLVKSLKLKGNWSVKELCALLVFLEGGGSPTASVLKRRLRARTDTTESEKFLIAVYTRQAPDSRQATLFAPSTLAPDSFGDYARLMMGDRLAELGLHSDAIKFTFVKTRNTELSAFLRVRFYQYSLLSGEVNGFKLLDEIEHTARQTKGLYPLSCFVNDTLRFLLAAFCDKETESSADPIDPDLFRSCLLKKDLEQCMDLRKIFVDTKKKQVLLGKQLKTKNRIHPIKNTTYDLLPSSKLKQSWTHLQLSLADLTHKKWGRKIDSILTDKEKPSPTLACFTFMFKKLEQTDPSEYKLGVEELKEQIKTYENLSYLGLSSRVHLETLLLLIQNQNKAIEPENEAFSNARSLFCQVRNPFLKASLLLVEAARLYKFDFNRAVQLLKAAQKQAPLGAMKKQIKVFEYTALGKSFSTANQSILSESIVLGRRLFSLSLEQISPGLYCINQTHMVDLRPYPVLERFVGALLPEPKHSVKVSRLQQLVWGQGIALEGWKQKIRNSLSRLRKIFRVSPVPLFIQKGGVIRLNSGFMILYSSQENQLSQRKKVVLQTISKQNLSSMEISHKTRIPIASVKRILRDLTGDSQVSVLKLGRNKLYQRTLQPHLELEKQLMTSDDKPNNELI